MAIQRQTGGDGSYLKRINAVVALRALHRGSAMTIREVATTCGVSRNTAEDAVSELVDRGLAEELAPTTMSGARSVGRPARRFRFRHEAGQVLGIDLAGQELRLVIADLEGQWRQIAQAEISTPEYPRRFAAVKEVTRQALAAAGLATSDIMCAGIAISGVVDSGGRVTRSSVHPALEGRNLDDDLAGLGFPLVFGNDARLATLAEQWCGVARDADTVVSVLAGPQISAGIIMNGEVVFGSRGAAGEMGVLPAAGWQEARDLVALWLELTERKGDAAGIGAAQSVLRPIAQALANGIAALVLAVDPECVVICGPLAEAGDELAGALKMALRDRTISPVSIRMSSLGHEAVAVGALRHALRRVEGELLSMERNRFLGI